MPRQTMVKAKNLREGDFFDGFEVVEVRITQHGRASFKLEDGSWRRRPAEERITIERNGG